MSQNKEIRALTGIRGIAALYVAFYHSLEYRGATDEPIFQTFINHGPLAVDLFFMLSGFVMTLSSKKYFEGKISLETYLTFMRKRFSRLYPMYFVVLVFVFVFLNNLDGKYNFIIGLGMLSMVLSGGFVMLHLWSLCAEWVAYLVYPVLMKLCYKFNSILWTSFITIIAVVLIYYSIELSHSHKLAEGSSISKVPAIIRCLSAYILGIISFQIVSKWPSIFKYQNLISAISVISIVWLLCIPGTGLIVICLFAPLIIGISSDQSWFGALMASKVIYFFGLISYSLYLIHPIFLVIFKDYFYQTYNHLMYPSLLFNTLYVIMITLFSYLTFKIIELPVQRILNNKLRIHSFLVTSKESEQPKVLINN